MKSEGPQIQSSGWVSEAFFRSRRNGWRFYCVTYLADGPQPEPWVTAKFPTPRGCEVGNVTTTGAG